MIIPLADATAVSFTSPLIVAALSPLILGEKISLHRWGAVAVVFLGAVILLRPVFSGESVGYIIAFSSGICVGFFYITSRKLAHDGAPFATIVYPAYIGLIILSPLIPFKWTAPRPQDVWLIIGFVILTSIAQTMVLSAFRFGQASLIAPFHYMHIVGATFFGYLFFSEFPDPLTWIGVIVVVGSGLYIAVRENKIQAEK